MIVLDTSVAVAYMDARDDWHARVLDWFDRLETELVTTPLAMAEMDHIVRGAGGREAARHLHATFQVGLYVPRWWGTALSETLRIAEARPEIGLTDASLVALAGHVGTTRIATLDERHFRHLEPLTGEAAFTLLPADAD